jgi:site-specific recombinase XerD
MEPSAKTTKLKTAIQVLEENMKKKSRTLPSSLRKSLIVLIEKNSEIVTVKGNKIILPVQFYPKWITEHKLDKDTEMVDSQHYNFFKKLRKYGLIHVGSSYFPKKLALISMNPTVPFLYKGNIKNVAKYTHAKETLYKVDNFFQNGVDAYIDLRLYQAFMLTTKEIEAINTSNIVFTSEDSAYIYIENIGIFDNTEIPPYYLIPIRGTKLVSILKQYKQDGVLHPFLDLDTDMKNKLSEHRQKNFPNLSVQEIRMASQNHLLMSSSPLMATLATSRKIMSQVTIAEIHSLYPSTVPQHLIQVEEARILNALERTKNIDDEQNFIDSSFSMEEFEYFNELMEAKNNSIFMKKIEPCKRELNQYASTPGAEVHGIMIAKYIVYLLSSVDKENKDRYIAASTFRDYYHLVKKHLFDNIEDLSNVQTHEINEILQNLAINKYKDVSIMKVKSLITDFFKFHGEKHNAISMNLATYPKSLVFESEIDSILKEIDNFHKMNKKEAEACYEILRDKAIVIIARYTGLRKSELRSRLMKDIYIYDDALCVDVNIEGLKKLEMGLKTESAKRRVCSKIANEAHLNIINDYIYQRERIKTKNKFFFLHANEKKPDVVKEEVFDNLTKIIQNITDRYTSFHSLRHTFATYSVKDILECKKVNPYKLIDLAMMMGHTSPEITLKKYTHRSVIETMEVSYVS